MKIRYFLASMIITIVVTTGFVLMSFAEYNTARYMVDDVNKMTEFLFDEETVSVGVFGERMSVQTKDVSAAIQQIEPFLPSEIKLGAELFRILAEYMGEAW